MCSVEEEPRRPSVEEEPYNEVPQETTTAVSVLSVYTPVFHLCTVVLCVTSVHRVEESKYAHKTVL